MAEGFENFDNTGTRLNRYEKQGEEAKGRLFYFLLEQYQWRVMRSSIAILKSNEFDFLMLIMASSIARKHVRRRWCRTKCQPYITSANRLTEILH